MRVLERATTSGPGREAAHRAATQKAVRSGLRAIPWVPGGAILGVEGSAMISPPAHRGPAWASLFSPDSPGLTRAGALTHGAVDERETEMDDVQKLAEDHIGWWMRSVRQLLIDNFCHGYKHGQDDAMCTIHEDTERRVDALEARQAEDDRELAKTAGAE